MSWLLNFIYVCFLVVITPWLIWRSLVHGKNRRGWSQKLFGSVTPRTSDAPCIWMHAVSVGEVLLLVPVIDQLRQSRPDIEVVISTTTETGFEIARQKFPDHYVFFCPMDFTWAIKRVLKRLRPNVLALAELELWPNLIRTTSRQGIPVTVVNGRLSESSFNGYRRIKWLIGPVFRRLSIVGAQNQTYSQRFRRLGCPPSNIVITGSVKFDRIETDRKNPKTAALSQLAGIADNQTVFLAGSTQLEEDLLAAEVYQRMSQSNRQLRLILAPRHPERCETLAATLNQRGISTIYRSQLNQDTAWNRSLAAGPTQGRLEPVLIVDVIGELGSWWGCSDMAYVGGSLGNRGGQNMIEPAAYGIPISFGPNTDNFKDIVTELLANDAATVIHNAEELLEFLTQALTNPTWSALSGARAKSVVTSHSGASQRTVAILSNLLSHGPDNAQDQSKLNNAA